MPERILTVAKRPHSTFPCVKLRYGGSERVLLEYSASLAEMPFDIRGSFRSILLNGFPGARELLGLLMAALARELTCKADNRRTVRTFFQGFLSATQ